MVYYIRTDKGDTIFDCEVYNKVEWNGDIRNEYTTIATSIDLVVYTFYMMEYYTEHGLDELKSLLYDFTTINDVNEWLQHGYYSDKENDGKDLEFIRKQVKELLSLVTENRNLEVIED